MSDVEEGGIGGRFGKVRKLFDEKVVSKLKDSDARENVMHQVSEHADTLKDAGMSLAARFTGGADKGDGKSAAEGEVAAGAESLDAEDAGASARADESSDEQPRDGAT